MLLLPPDADGLVEPEGDVRQVGAERRAGLAVLQRGEGVCRGVVRTRGRGDGRRAVACQAQHAHRDVGLDGVGPSVGRERHVGERCRGASRHVDGVAVPVTGDEHGGAGGAGYAAVERHRPRRRTFLRIDEQEQGRVRRRPQRRRAGKHVQRSGVGGQAQLLEIRRVLVGRVAVVLLHVERTRVRCADLARQVGLEHGLEAVGVRSGLGQRVDDPITLGVAAIVGAVRVEEMVGVDVLAAAVYGGAAVVGGRADPTVERPVRPVDRWRRVRRRRDRQCPGVLAGVEQGRFGHGRLSGDHARGHRNQSKNEGRDDPPTTSAHV